MKTLTKTSIKEHFEDYWDLYARVVILVLWVVFLNIILGSDSYKTWSRQSISQLTKGEVLIGLLIVLSWTKTAFNFKLKVKK